jgi:hypothetical protein
MTEPADHTTRLRDRVREQSERIEALEAALLEVRSFSRNDRVHEIIDRALSAPETVETQG